MRALAVTALCLCRVAAAQTSAAAKDQALTDEGIELMRGGRHAEAIARFKEAERAVPRHVHDCNIAQAYLRLDRLPQAFLFLERCEARMGRSPESWVRSSLEALRKRLEAGPFGRVTVRATPSGATLWVRAFAADEGWPVDGERTLWLPAGPSEVELRAEGMQAQVRTVEVAAGATAEVRVALAPPVLEAVVAPPPEAKALRRARWPLIPMGVGAAGLLASGLVLGLSASTAGQLGGLSADQTSQAFELAARSQQYDGVGFGLLGGGAVIAVVGLLLFLALPQVQDT